MPCNLPQSWTCAPLSKLSKSLEPIGYHSLVLRRSTVLQNRTSIRLQWLLIITGLFEITVQNNCCARIAIVLYKILRRYYPPGGNHLIISTQNISTSTFPRKRWRPTTVRTSLPLTATFTSYRRPLKFYLCEYYSLKNERLSFLYGTIGQIDGDVHMQDCWFIIMHSNIEVNLNKSWLVISNVSRAVGIVALNIGRFNSA